MHVIQMMQSIGMIVVETKVHLKKNVMLQEHIVNVTPIQILEEFFVMLQVNGKSTVMWVIVLVVEEIHKVINIITHKY